MNAVYDANLGGWRFIEQEQQTQRETKAKRLLRTCGIRMASLYLKKRGYSAEQAVIILLK